MSVESAARVVIVDSGCANVASVSFAFERLGTKPQVSADASVIAGASHVVLPGVGTAPTFMANLRARGLTDCVRALRQPCLGICLGMQLMYEVSDEGAADALGVFAGRVRHLPEGGGVTVPHMGWNQLDVVQPDNVLLQGVSGGDYAYFVHSYYAPKSALTTATTHHAVEITAMAAQGNFYGCQFHPERSGRTGARVLANFLSLR